MRLRLLMPRPQCDSMNWALGDDVVCPSVSLMIGLVILTLIFVLIFLSLTLGICNGVRSGEGQSPSQYTITTKIVRQHGIARHPNPHKKTHLRRIVSILYRISPKKVAGMLPLKRNTLCSEKKTPTHIFFHLSINYLQKLQ